MVSPGRTPRLILAVALLAAACDAGPAEPPAGFPFASARPDCGPADGPAVTINLRQDSLPTLPPGGARVRMYLWHSLAELQGRSWPVGGRSQEGVADYQDATGTTTTLRGTVSITDVRSDSTVEGEVDLTSGGAYTVRGAFRAPWIPGAPMCL